MSRKRYVSDKGTMNETDWKEYIEGVAFASEKSFLQVYAMVFPPIFCCFYQLRCVDAVVETRVETHAERIKRDTEEISGEFLT